MKKLLLLLALSLFAVAPALAADHPKAEIFGGYSYARVDLLVDHDNAHGWEASIAGNPTSWFGLEGDVSGHYGDGFDTMLFLFGPRFAARLEGVTPWVHGLVGLSRFDAGTVDSDDLAYGFGGGIDTNLAPHIALRVIQADYIIVREPFGASQDSKNIRLSSGLVIKF